MIHNKKIKPTGSIHLTEIEQGDKHKLMQVVDDDVYGPSKKKGTEQDSTNTKKPEEPKFHRRPGSQGKEHGVENTQEHRKNNPREELTIDEVKQKHGDDGHLRTKQEIEAERAEIDKQRKALEKENHKLSDMSKEFRKKDREGRFKPEEFKAEQEKLMELADKFYKEKEAPLNELIMLHDSHVADYNKDKDVKDQLPTYVKGNEIKAQEAVEQKQKEVQENNNQRAKEELEKQQKREEKQKEKQEKKNKKKEGKAKPTSSIDDDSANDLADAQENNKDFAHELAQIISNILRHANVKVAGEQKNSVDNFASITKTDGKDIA